MLAYHRLVEHVLQHGTRKENRTGVDTLSTFHVAYDLDFGPPRALDPPRMVPHFALGDRFPLLTTKKISWKNIVVELLWFLSGQTHIGFLRRHGCKFWDAWADPETGDVPSAYGNFWRHFPVHVTVPVLSPTTTMTTTPRHNDQIRWVLDELRKSPMSRRLVVSAWAPGNAQASKLPPCHLLFAFNVQNRTTSAGVGPRLCLHLTQRSCDVALGVPYNIASYALLLQLFSRLSGIAPGVFAHTLLDAHVYTKKPDGSMAEYDHVPGLREQLGRERRPLPRLHIADSIRTLEDVEALLGEHVSTDDILRAFRLDEYDPHPEIKFKVAV